MTTTNVKESRTIRLPWEIGTVTLITFAKAGKAFKSMYVGMEPGEYILLRLPPGAGVHDHLFEGNSAVIKFIAEGTVYGFHTSVIGYMYKKRIILVALAYPVSMETRVLRAEHRINFFVPATLTVTGNQLPGLIVDISPSGCRFTFDTAPEAQPYDFTVIKDVNLSFQLPGIQGNQVFGCLVKNVSADSNRNYLGLKFEKVNESILTEIEEYVRQVTHYLETV